MRWFNRLFRARSLALVRGPTRVALRGAIAAPNLVQSPISGRREALIHYSFFLRPRLGDTMVGRRWSGTAEVLVATGLLFEPPLLIETPGGVVEVPATRLRVFCSGALSGGVRIEPPLPPPMSHVEALARRHGRGELYYRELWLSVGDRVRLVGTVARTVDRGAAYRVSGAAQFRVDSTFDAPLIVAEE